MNFQDINKELDLVSKQIRAKTQELEEKRREYIMAKAEYEHLYSKSILETKIKNPDMSASELKAQAICLSYDNKLALIKKESEYKKLLSELNSLRDRLDGLKEIAYNERAEARMTQVLGE